MKRQNRKNLVFGFTLIELIVVIAVIGILSAIVLGVLNGARNKGGDAGVKSNLAGIRSQAEILNDTWGVYGVDATPTPFVVGACSASPDTLFSDPNISAQITAAGNASNGGGMGQGSCVSASNAWAVSMPLKEDQANSWCVDNKGTSRQVTPAGGDRGFLGVACK